MLHTFAGSKLITRIRIRPMRPLVCTEKCHQVPDPNYATQGFFFTKYVKSGTAKKDAHPTLSPRTILKMGAYWPKNGQQKSLPEGHQLDRSEVFCPALVRYCWSIRNT